MKLNWLSENKELADKFKEIKLQIFKDDLMRDFELDIFDNLAKNKIPNDYYNEIDYALVEDNDSIVGLVGYYNKKDFKHSRDYWIGWFGVLAGTGSFLNSLQYICQKEVNRGKVQIISNGMIALYSFLVFDFMGGLSCTWSTIMPIVNIYRVSKNGEAKYYDKK